MDVIMKLKLNKKKLKNLSKDSNVLPADMTPQVGGGTDLLSLQCNGTIGCGNLTTHEPDARPITWRNCSPSDFGSCVDC